MGCDFQEYCLLKTERVGSRCDGDHQCKGKRFCNLRGYCEGKDYCEDLKALVFSPCRIIPERDSDEYIPPPQPKQTPKEPLEPVKPQLNEFQRTIQEIQQNERLSPEQKEDFISYQLELEREDKEEKERLRLKQLNESRVDYCAKHTDCEGWSTCNFETDTCQGETECKKDSLYKKCLTDKPSNTNGSCRRDTDCFFGQTCDFEYKKCLGASTCKTYEVPKQIQCNTQEVGRKFRDEDLRNEHLKKTQSGLLSQYKKWKAEQEKYDVEKQLKLFKHENKFEKWTEREFTEKFYHSSFYHKEIYKPFDFIRLPFKCQNDTHCQGLKYCDRGECKGESRCNPPKACSKDESKNPLGNEVCRSNSDRLSSRYCGRDRRCQGAHLCVVGDCLINEKDFPVCSRNEQCQGNRYCSGGSCQGVSACPKLDCTIDERVASGTYGVCQRNEHCWGMRQCVDSKCKFTSGCEAVKTEENCLHDEKVNYWGEGRCLNTNECKGERHCVNGYCSGKANCKGEERERPTWVPSESQKQFLKMKRQYDESFREIRVEEKRVGDLVAEQQKEDKQKFKSQLDNFKSEQNEIQKMIKREMVKRQRVVSRMAKYKPDDCTLSFELFPFTYFQATRTGQFRVFWHSNCLSGHDMLFETDFREQHQVDFDHHPTKAILNIFGNYVLLEFGEPELLDRFDLMRSRQYNTCLIHNLEKKFNNVKLYERNHTLIKPQVFGSFNFENFQLLQEHPVIACKPMVIKKRKKKQVPYQEYFEALPVRNLNITPREGYRGKWVFYVNKWYKVKKIKYDKNFGTYLFIYAEIMIPVVTNEQGDKELHIFNQTVRVKNQAGRFYVKIKMPDGGVKIITLVKTR